MKTMPSVFIMVGMDESNRRIMVDLFDGDVDNKIHLLLEYSNVNRDVLDPWYTHDYETAYKDISKGCLDLINKLI